VPPYGALQESGDPFEPYRLLDASGEVVAPVAAYLRDLQARGLPETTQRSYGMALLRWFRFLGAIEVPWEQATRVEARDFSRWVQVAAKPVRPHWRHRDESAAETGPTPAQPSPNPVTDKAPPGTRYAPATAAHSETVLRSFYEFHLEAGSGPMVNPFPLSRNRRGGRANAHHNPMEPFRNERSGLYRPRVVARAPRQIPDEKFDELFAALGSHRDRALVALWVSTGARASELLGLTCEDSDPGQQLITVIRKGSRALQQLPASSDAFVWLRLYQQMQDLVPRSGSAVVVDAAAPDPPVQSYEGSAVGRFGNGDDETLHPRGQNDRPGPTALPVQPLPPLAEQHVLAGEVTPQRARKRPPARTAPAPAQPLTCTPPPTSEQPRRPRQPRPHCRRTTRCEAAHREC